MVSSNSSVSSAKSSGSSSFKILVVGSSLVKISSGFAA